MSGKHSDKTNSTKTKTKTSKKKIVGKIFLVIFIIIVLLVIAAGTYVGSMLGKINTEKIDTSNIGIDEETAEELSGFRNIALLGIDSREDDYGVGNRSDCIIIASINQETNEIALISVYRDTYMLVENSSGTETYDKVTHAYAYGGAQNTLKALNTNLDLNITEYVTVNFDAVIAAVDALGGISINIESNEIEYMNDYIDQLIKSSGVSSTHITSTGTQTLDGVQAVAYSRIRYTSGGDYKRTERMRTVLTAMLTKAKTLSVTKLNSLANTILPKISTNISSTEILSLIPTLATYSIGDSIGWPYEVQGITLDRWYGVAVTLESNVVQLHQEVFGQTDYVISDKIKSISDTIVSKTGYSN